MKTCADCNGKGYHRGGFLWLSTKTCSTCKGSGEAPQLRPVQRTPEDEAFIGQTYRCDAFRTSRASTARPAGVVPSPQSGADNNDPLTTGLLTEAVGGDGLTAGVVSSLTGSDTLGVIAGLAAEGSCTNDDPDRFGGGHSGGAGASGDFHDPSPNVDHGSHGVDHGGHDVDVSDDGPDLDFDLDFD